MVNAVYSRATRNCYWVGSLWGAALRALDRFGAGKEELQDTCKAALAAGMQVCSVCVYGGVYMKACVFFFLCLCVYVVRSM